MNAYIDAGAASVVATVLVGGFAGVMTVLRSTGSKFTGIFKRNKGEEDTEVEAVETAEV